MVQDTSLETVVAEAAALINSEGWNAHPKARFCVLYIIGPRTSNQKL